MRSSLEGGTFRHKISWSCGAFGLLVFSYNIFTELFVSLRVIHNPGRGKYFHYSVFHNHDIIPRYTMLINYGLEIFCWLNITLSLNCSYMKSTDQLWSFRETSVIILERSVLIFLLFMKIKCMQLIKYQLYTTNFKKISFY